MGGVGSGTTIDYVEIFANQDDGIEFFGGTAQVKHAVVVNQGDDAFDYDEGWRGKGQFWLTVQNGDSDRGGEHDGGTDPEDGTPYAHPVIANATYIGNGSSRTVTLRDNAGGEYHNSLFVNFGKGIDIEDLKDSKGEDSYSRFQQGILKIENNTFDFAITSDKMVVTNASKDSTSAGATEEDTYTVASQQRLAASTADVSADAQNKGNLVESTGVSATNLVPATAGGSVSVISDPFFTAADYRGAFAPGGSNWAEGWTKAHAVGLID